MELELLKFQCILSMYFLSCIWVPRRSFKVEDSKSIFQTCDLGSQDASLMLSILKVLCAERFDVPKIRSRNYTVAFGYSSMDTH